MKKIFGYLLIALFFAIGVGCFIYNILTSGWYFLIAMLLMLLLFGMLVLGIYLINKK